MSSESRKVMKWLKARLKKPDELTNRQIYLLKRDYHAWYVYACQYRIMAEAVDNPDDYFEQVSALEKYKKTCPYCGKLVETERDDGQASTAVAAHVFNKSDTLHGGHQAYPDDWNVKKTEDYSEDREASSLLDY